MTRYCRGSLFLAKPIVFPYLWNLLPFLLSQRPRVDFCGVLKSLFSPFFFKEKWDHRSNSRKYVVSFSSQKVVFFLGLLNDINYNLLHIK